ncbi:AGE family epimerase/isomerase [Qipengyuania atrilutea]|uniref:AGE family epimerase/isomerase n=1 Tax=Qipengyuania atrilutea TaxID=2744473 RepID=A0A850H3Z4_9SPHN|nr:AGE family epimerase/isomerase [Actirhodobacter atriluteus]NVD44618.1 AGE family epimerase/isomerase [Actirhodobacter atriluteus]
MQSETNGRANLELAQRAKGLSERARGWMLDSAFPFWAERTPSPDGGFYERLDLTGEGIPGEPSRVRLQARMGFTFALAADLGWDRDRSIELTRRSVETLTRDCRREDGLYGAMVRPGSGLTDDTPETYDNAFALLAFATATRVFAMDEAREAGEALVAAIERELKRPETEGGYAERLPVPDVRTQNPHMHLTEASLAWYEATSDEASLKRAEDLAAFVHDHFYRADLGLLVEKSGVPDAENHVEAGHLFEWVWILGRLRDLGGTPPEGFASNLHEGGMRLLEGLGYLPLSQGLDGSVREAFQRTWGPTEKLKGHIAHWREHPSPELAERIVATCEALFADHVDGALPGAWIDKVGPEKASLIEDITPATGYHIFLALQEFMAFAREIGG